MTNLSHLSDAAFGTIGGNDYVPVIEGAGGNLQRSVGAVGRLSIADLGTALGVTTISARAYGAVGDGVADDTGPLNAAILGAVGKVLIIPPGTYRTTSTVILQSNTTISGYGATIVPIAAGSFPPYAALNSAVDNAGGITPSSRPILSNADPVAGNVHINIYGLAWTGNANGSSSMHGLHVHKVTGLTLFDCTTIECLSPIALLQSNDVYVVICKISGFRNGGIDTWTGCKRVHIIDNLIDCTALNSDGSNHGIFVTSEPTDGAGDAATYHADHYIVSGNTILNAETHGIWIGGGDATLNRVNDTARWCKVFDNLIYNCGGCGAILERSEDCEVTDNTFINVGNHGVFTRKNVSAGTAYCDRPTISRNNFRNVGTVTAGSKFIHMDDTTRDAVVEDNRGSGTAHTYALFDQTTNSGLWHHGNRFTAGTSGTFNILSADNDNYTGIDGRVVYRGATVSGTAITLFDAATQGAAWEVVCRNATVGAAVSYARFIVYGCTGTPVIVAAETAGAITYTLTLSGTSVRATSVAGTTISVYTATPL